MKFIRKTQPKIKTQFNKFVIPSIGAMWFFSLYTMVDGAFVGKGVGPHALAGVNISMPYISLLFAIAIVFSIGSSNMVSYHLGRGEKEIGDKIFTQSVLLILIVGLTISAIAFFNLENLVDALGAEGQIAEYAYNYLKVIAPFSTFFMLSYNLEVFVKADGHPSISVRNGVISSLTNIILDYVFVFIYGWGIEGAAIATVISQVLASVLYLWHFIWGDSKLQFLMPKFNGKKILAAIKLGIPEALTEMSIGFTTFLYNFSIIKYLGIDYITTYSIIMYVNNLVVNTMIAISQGSQPLVSYYYGDENKNNLKDLARLMTLTALFWGLAFSIITWIFSRQIVSLFISEDLPYLFSYSVEKLKIFSLGFIITGLSIVIAGYLTAIKQARQGFIISLLRGYINISIVLLTIPVLFGGDFIWISSILSEALTLIIAAYLAYRTLPKLQRKLSKKKE